MSILAFFGASKHMLIYIYITSLFKNKKNMEDAYSVRDAESQRVFQEVKLI